MIFLTGGGTGGHLRIIQTIKQELKSSNTPLVYIGSTNGQDRDWFGDDGDFDKVHFLPTKGFSSGLIPKIKATLWLMVAFVKGLQLFIKYRPKVVFSVGGFSSAPMALLAIATKTPLYIHEQNSIMGRLNALCRPFAKAIYCAFDVPSATHAPYPVGQDFFAHARSRESLACILVMGGSAGASFLNQLILQIAPQLQSRGVRIIHQTGKRDFEMVSQAYEQMQIKADVFEFASCMSDKMSQADMAISRAGASSVWELVANGLPSLFVPYPYAVSNHQYHNACFFSKRDLGIVLEQSCLDQSVLLEAVDLISADLGKVSNKLLQEATKGGSKLISQTLLAYI